MQKSHVAIIPRVLIGVVLLLNVQCAVLFLAAPGLFAPGFELSGIPGDMMVRGMGILFLMWNIPYGFALSDPWKRKISLVEAVLMQASGLVGECMLVLSLPSGHAWLRSTGLRFIYFDAGGFLFLAAALWFVS